MWQGEPLSVVAQRQCGREGGAHWKRMFSGLRSVCTSRIEWQKLDAPRGTRIKATAQTLKCSDATRATDAKTAS